MSARAELISMVNDIRLDFDQGKGTLGEVADRVQEIANRAFLEQVGNEMGWNQADVLVEKLHDRLCPGHDLHIPGHCQPLADVLDILKP